MRSENVGPVTFRGLLARYGSAQAALRALPELCPPRWGLARPEAAAASPRRKRRWRRWRRWARALSPSESPSIRRFSPTSTMPRRCSAVLGEPSGLHRPCVAIVGARNASLNGRRLAAMLAGDLGAAGVLRRLGARPRHRRGRA